MFAYCEIQNISSLVIVHLSPNADAMYPIKYQSNRNNRFRQLLLLGSRYVKAF